MRCAFTLNLIYKQINKIKRRFNQQPLFWQAMEETLILFPISLLLLVALYSVIQVTTLLYTEGFYTNFQSLSNNLRLSLCFCFVLVLYLAFAYLIFKHRNRFKHLNFVQFKRAKTYLKLIAYQVLIFLGNVTIMHLFKMSGTTKNEQFLDTLFKSNDFRLAYLAIITILIAPVIEELIFRLFIFSFFNRLSRKLLNNVSNTELKHRLSLAITVCVYLLSSSLFSLSHEPTNLPSFLIYFFMGLVLAYNYNKGGVTRSISLHTLNNALAFVGKIIA